MNKLYLFLVTFLLTSCPAKAEDRVVIAIADTGVAFSDYTYPLLCRDGHVDLTGKGIEDHYGHGSVITDIISQGLDPAEYCLLIVKWYDTATTRLPSGILGKAIDAAIDKGARIINISAGGPGEKAEEALSVRRAIANGIVLVVAAGNEHNDLSEDCDSYPACYSIKNSLFHVVADYLFGHKAPYSNYGGPVTDTADGRYMYKGKSWSGTSMATAKITNKIARQHGYTRNRQ